MPTGSEHIVRSFDNELQGLNQIIVRMGGMAESMLATAIEALVKRDSDLAAKVIRADKEVDALEKTADEMAIKLIALRQPMANDLREVIAALKIASDIERIGDLAKNLAKRTLALNQAPPAHPAYAIPRMANLVQGIIKDTLDAYVARDAERALDVWHRDEEVDEMYTGLFRELLTYMMEDPRNITSSTHLLFIAKNIERMGDHATNIAENIYYLAKGEQLEGRRPKGDQSSFEVVNPPAGGEAEENEAGIKKVTTQDSRENGE
jgi:phosphate transport system protein